MHRARHLAVVKDDSGKLPVTWRVRKIGARPFSGCSPLLAAGEAEAEEKALIRLAIMFRPSRFYFKNSSWGLRQSRGLAEEHNESFGARQIGEVHCMGLLCLGISGQHARLVMSAEQTGVFSG
jgi:hypothetical protein